MAEQQLRAEAPATDGVALDPERQARAREYARLRRTLLVVDLGLGAAIGLAWLLSGGSAWLRDVASARAGSAWGVVGLYALAAGAGLIVLRFPLQVYSGFVLPHRYGLATQSFKAWAVDVVKATLLGGALGLVMLEVMYALLRATPSWWWLWTAGVMLLFTVVLANLAPVLIFPLFYKFTPVTDEALVARLKALAERAGARVRGVYRFDMSSKTRAANAAVVGLGNTRRIILGDTLLTGFTGDEIETVLAHELGHHVHGDVGKGVALSTALTLGGLYLASLALASGAAALGLVGIADVAGLPLLGLVMGAYGLLTMPLENSWSRWRETMADAYALATTQKPRAFASAMTRLANQNLGEVAPPRWVEIALMSHPAIARRIALARDFAAAAGVPDGG